ncbi:MAG TPA: lytic transglycosylase [Bacteroidales bacterium]|nr:MAG: Membrane-bound lytic murein transglycosylase D precursor [Bacteroidetes bacterium ADurb.Bin416]HBL72463.1 lytic transglycosylase [Bacteroidales bacterium]
MNRLFALLLCLLCSAPFLANDSIPSASELTGQVWTDDGIDIPESLNTDLDSLLRDWHIKASLTKRKDCDCDTNHIPSYSDDVLIQRLAAIPTIIPMSFNPVTKRCIDLYTKERRLQVQVMLGLERYYNTLFEHALERHQMPLELKYLPVVESALNPNAVSRAGATGLWQFMFGTGKMYGLEINTLVDERRDPIKATDAAVSYLKDLYHIFGDWHLAIAAYNCGPGNVNKAIRRAGGKKDYWEVYNYLPRETRGYVPLFIAANYVMRYYKEHNLCPIETNLTTITDTLWLDRKVHFDQITAVIGVPKETIHAMNPQYRHSIIPGSPDKPHVLCLPAEYSLAYIDYQDSIPKYLADTLLNENKLLASPKNSLASASGNYQIYKVKKGDTLSTIASRQRVTVSKLKQWNGLHTSRIYPGQRLKIY